MTCRFTIDWPEKAANGMILTHPRSKGRKPIVYPHREFMRGGSNIATRNLVVLQRFDRDGPPEVLAAFGPNSTGAALQWAIDYVGQNPECDLWV
jgi:hypothetical protein